MQLVRHTDEIPPTSHPVVLAMGCFDGVHLGHQAVISTAVQQAEALRGEAWVFTFSPHPAKVLNPEHAPPLISAPPCRLRTFEALGVRGVIEIPFDRHYAHTAPDLFLTHLREKIPTLAGVVCGWDWSFGYRAAGTFDTLQKMCTAHGLSATAIQPVLIDGQRVSSTRVRQAVAEGNIPLAAQLLGRPVRLFGTVVKGHCVGRTLGYPTANIDPLNELLPGAGVYCARTRVAERWIGSAVFVGQRKTFHCAEHVVESHLLDFEGELYGRELEIVLLQKIRDPQRFDSRAALVAQIGKDLSAIRAHLNTHGARQALRSK